MGVGDRVGQSDSRVCLGRVEQDGPGFRYGDSAVFLLASYVFVVLLCVCVFFFSFWRKPAFLR